MRGFTLIEVLGVIILVGLVLALTMPRFQHSEEKTAVKMIARVISADLKRVKQEAILNQNSLAVEFRVNGYCFDLGGQIFERNFKRYGFCFKTSPNLNVDTDAKASIEDITGPVEAEADTDELALATQELIFNDDGSCSGLTLIWETRHYQGALIVDQNGEVTWDYAY